MDNKIKSALEEFVGMADNILDKGVLSAYCFGSAAYEDFRIGYSDLDFFIITSGEITQRTFDEFSALRTEFKLSKHPFLSVLEGEIISNAAVKNDTDSNTIYWGTSKDRLNQRYTLSGFSLRGLIDKGYLIYGEEMRDKLPYPDNEEMLLQVDHMIDTVREYAMVTKENVHSVDWFFLISQSIYWLKTSNINGKSNAAQWIINNCDYSWTDTLEKALEIRYTPEIAGLAENREWLRSLGPVVQIACDSLVFERNELRERLRWQI